MCMRWFFFFSSRRRHTRCSRDWSSDVCSSDLLESGDGWDHPVHVHFEEGQILLRGGLAPPMWEKWARKDMYRIGGHPENTSRVTLAIRVREFLGTYVEHCHNTTHEDTAMLLRWDSRNPGQV